LYCTRINNDTLTQEEEEEESFTKEATKSAKPMKGRKQEIEMKLSSSSRS